MTATDDQAEAARAEMTARMAALLPPSVPHIRGDHSGDPVYQLAAAALDAATDPDHPERCCPHVRGIRPYMLDMHRGLLTCGRCRRSDQFELLPGDEEHRCDRCRALVAPADECIVLLNLTGFVVTAAMVCRACWSSYTGTDAP